MVMKQTTIFHHSGDKAEVASGDVDAKHIERDTILRNTLATLEITFGHTKFIDVSGPWCDIEEGCYTYEPTLRSGSSEQQGITSAFTREQPQFFSQILPATTTISNHQQAIDCITQSTSLDSLPHHTFPRSFSEPSKSAGASGRENDEILRTGAGLTTADIRFL